MQEHLFERRPGVDPSWSFVDIYVDPSSELLPDSGYARSLATRHWGTHVVVPADLREAGAHVQERVCETVLWQDIENNGVANVFDVSKRYAARNFNEHLAPLLAAFGVEKVNEYETAWLACREVDFHLDEELGGDEAFIVWHVAGAPKAVDFPCMGFGVTMQPGDALLFDGYQTHGVRKLERAGRPFPLRSEAPSSLPPRAKRQASELSVFLSLSLPYTPQLLERMGMTTGPLTECMLDFRTNSYLGDTEVTQRRPLR